MSFEKGSREPGFCGLIGKSQPMRELCTIIVKCAACNATTLLYGESGTGKELVARAIHRLSTRSGGPFVALNCGALPPNLVESEFFGHERGAFSGAFNTRPGRFEMAHGGTLFLDEIGEMPLNMQVKLLRVLQEQEFERVGGTATIRTDVRIVAATNRRLDQEVASGGFRQDLYYRLTTLPIAVPPLRMRKSDIPLLVDHFIKKHCEAYHQPPITISHTGLRALMQYDFPGNVRELENLIARAVVLADGGTISIDPKQDLFSDYWSFLDTCDNLPAIKSEKLLQALKQVTVPTPSGVKYWHKSLKCTTIERLHAFLLETGSRFFSRAEVNQFLVEDGTDGKSKYKTAGEILKLLARHQICAHNGRRANQSRYKLADNFFANQGVAN